MGLFSRNKPKIKVQVTKRDGYSGWIKCSKCLELIHANELEANLSCCPKCDYHYRLSLLQRIKNITDEDSFDEMFTNIQPVDALGFEDTERYTDRLKRSKRKSERDEAIAVGRAYLQEREIALAVMDFSFMGGSMGSVLGERLTCIIEYAIEHNLPLILVSASGGARMQESILSLMQMAKTASALRRLSDKKIPYISILTNPTSGGVTASFATLGDVIIAEPDALIAFAGPRVVEQTIGQKLPKGAQKSEFLLKHGMIDSIVERKNLKKKVAFFLEFLTVGLEKQKASQKLKKLIDKSITKEHLTH